MQKQFSMQNKSVQRVCLLVAIALLLLVWALSTLTVIQSSPTTSTHSVPVALGMPALDAASKDSLSGGHSTTCLSRADYCGDGV